MTRRNIFRTGRLALITAFGLAVSTPAGGNTPPPPDNNKTLEGYWYAVEEGTPLEEGGLVEIRGDKMLVHCDDVNDPAPLCNDWTGKDLRPTGPNKWAAWFRKPGGRFWERGSVTLELNGETLTLHAFGKARGKFVRNHVHSHDAFAGLNPPQP